MDMYLVSVDAREPRTARLRLTINSFDEVTFPLSPSFAMMLIADEGADFFAIYSDCRDKKRREDE